MRRPLLVAGAGFAFATWTSFFIVDPRMPLMLSLACALSGVAARMFWKRGASVPCVMLLAAAVAFAMQPLYYLRAIEPLQNMAGETVEVLGVVTQAEMDAPFYTYTMNAAFPDRDLPDAILSVSGYGEMDYSTGDILLCSVTLSELNPVHRLYNYSRGVYVDARLQSAVLVPSSRADVTRQVLGFFARVRQSQVERISRNLPANSAGVVSAMVLGFSDSISQEVSAALSRSGTIHILSVSGLHLSVLSGCLMSLLRRLKVPRIARCLICAAGAVAFSLLVGFSPSITRALVMMLIWFAAQSASVRSDSLNSLGLALLLICIVCPQWTLNRGLWLSMCSTAGIAAFAGKLQALFSSRMKELGKFSRSAARLLVDAVCVSVAAYTFSLPVIVVTSGWIPVLSPLSNLLTAPLIAPAIAGGLICAFLPVGAAVTRALAWAVNLCVRAIVTISEMVSSLPFAVVALDQSWRLVWFALALSVAVLLYRRSADKLLVKYAAVLLVFSFAAGSLSLSFSSRNTIELITIERCSSAILLREDAAVIVGTPAHYEASRLIRYLNYRGVKRINAIIATDCGEQIKSGLLRLASEYPVDCVIGPDDAYILGELSRALPHHSIYPGGYSQIRALDAVSIFPDKLSDTVLLKIGGVSALKSEPEYDSRGLSSAGAVYIGGRGIMWWPLSAPPTFEPLGALLFGETRLILPA